MDSIGAFFVFSIRPWLEGLRQHLEVLKRPGVNGTGFVRTGIWGNPETVVTVRDELTVVTARTLYESYKNLINADPVQVTQAGLSSTAYGALYQVKDVRLAKDRNILPLLNSTGGFYGGLGRALLVCEWDLEAVPT